jgi:hypothetical protein
VYTIERWVQDWYGLNLHTDRDEWLWIGPTAVKAAAHAAGFITALDMTDRALAAQLATNRQSSIDQSVRLLAASRDLAWQSITALAAEAHRLGCTSLPTSPNPSWEPVCVRDQEVGRQIYPALRCGEEPDTPPRFTVKTAERISDDLSRQHGQRIRVSLTGDVLTVSFGEHAITRDTRHEPDQDGLYPLGAGSLIWQAVRGE